MYHRILPKDDPRYHLEEPGMLVTPETFEMHLIEAKKHFEIIHLSDWLERRNKGLPLPVKACAFTFDDGWLDNFEYALPLLIHHKVPATLFAVAAKIGTDFQFWPNCIATMLFNDKFSLLAQHPSARALLEGYSPPETMNTEFVALVIKQFKKLADEEIWRIIQACASSGNKTQSMPPDLMDWQQLREMSESGFVEIGCHTASHKRLSDKLTDNERHQEIIASQHFLQKNLSHRVKLFCFPNGDYDNKSLDLVTSTYLGAVTTQSGINTSKSSAHQLLRIGIHEQSSNNPTLFKAKLSGLI